MCYAGIGSRRTPLEILELMQSFAFYMARKSALLRTGGATGADQAFMSGCKDAGGRNQIFVPWNGYEAGACLGMNVVSDIPALAFEIAEAHHPAWATLKQTVRRLHARNSMILLGSSCQDPVDFVVAWTPGGTGAGGTGQALRVATSYDIDVLDLGAYSTIADMKHKCFELSQLEKSYD